MVARLRSSPGNCCWGNTRHSSRIYSEWFKLMSKLFCKVEVEVANTSDARNSFMKAARLARLWPDSPDLGDHFETVLTEFTRNSIQLWFWNTTDKMEDPSSVRAVPQILTHEKTTPVPEPYRIDDKGQVSEGSDSSVGSVKDDHGDRLRWNKVTVAFFLVGLLVSSALISPDTCPSSRGYRSGSQAWSSQQAPTRCSQASRAFTKSVPL